LSKHNLYPAYIECINLHICTNKLSLHSASNKCIIVVNKLKNIYTYRKLVRHHWFNCSVSNTT